MCGAVEPRVEDPYLLWGFTLDESSGRTTSGPDDPRDTAARIAGSWSPAVRTLVTAATSESLTAFPYVAADPGQPMASWRTGPITAIGDAVHAMPPTGGRGAATAIRDADVLARQLTEVASGRTTPAMAIEASRRQMADYAHDALRASLMPLRARRWLSPPALTGLRAAAALRQSTEQLRQRATPGHGAGSGIWATEPGPGETHLLR